MDKSIFRAYDIRGKYPGEINEKAVFEIAQALGRFFVRRNSAILIVAHDARLSSPSLYKSVLKGLSFEEGDPDVKKSGLRPKRRRKIKVIKVGLATTPMLYFLANHYKANGGIMVTASHNPKEYNGLKVIRNGDASVGGLEILKMVKRK